MAVDLHNPTPSAPVRRLLLPFSGVLLAMFIAALDQTIMATALPTIAGDLGGLSGLPWAVTAYVLAAAAATPVWGKASDLHGRKDLLRGAIVLFVAASALAGISQTIGELIAFRTIQGLGAGGVMTLAMATVGDLVPPRERGRYQGYIQFVFVLASVAGPLLGGLLVDHLSWRWVFYVNLPIGLGALALVTAFVDVRAERRPARIDVLGAALLAAAVSSILLLCTWGGDRYGWGSTPILALGAAAVVLLAAFVLREGIAPEPVLPLRLFRDPVFVVVSSALFITTLSLFAAIVFLPVFLQLVTGASATRSGLLVLPLLIASALTTVASGWIMARSGRYKVFPVIGLALMSAGLLLLSTLGAESSRLTAAVFMAVFGAGFGMVTQILMVAIQNAVEPREIGTATASANLFRALGGSVGVAVYGAVFNHGLRQGLTLKLHGRLPAGIDPHGIQASPGRIHAFAPAVQHSVAEAVAGALHEVFLIAGVIALTGFLVVLALREVPLRGRDLGSRSPQAKSAPSKSQSATA